MDERLSRFYVMSMSPAGCVASIVACMYAGSRYILGTRPNQGRAISPTFLALSFDWLLGAAAGSGLLTAPPGGAPPIRSTPRQGPVLRKQQKAKSKSKEGREKKASRPASKQAGRYVCTLAGDRDPTGQGNQGDTCT